MVIANEKPASCLFQFVTGDEPIVQDLKDQEFDLIVICDTGSFDMLGSIYSDHTEVFKNTQTVNIDHHGSCYGNICWSTSGHEFASATMMVGDFIREIDPVGITPYMGTALLLGLYFDTECFRNLNTNPASLRFAADMIELGADNGGLVRGLYQSTPACYFKLYGSVMQGVTSIAWGHGAIATIKNEFFESCGVHPDGLGNEFVNHYLRSLAVDFVVLIKDIGHERRMSFRSKTEAYNMRELAWLFGGGGHTMASGARTDMSVEECIALIETPLKIEE
jgi:bifunctional oligoribonuclease and PAP phosphatase NrnA